MRRAGVLGQTVSTTPFEVTLSLSTVSTVRGSSGSKRYAELPSLWRTAIWQFIIQGRPKLPER